MKERIEKILNELFSSGYTHLRSMEWESDSVISLDLVRTYCDYFVFEIKINVEDLLEQPDISDSAIKSSLKTKIDEEVLKFFHDIDEDTDIFKEEIRNENVKELLERKISNLEEFYDDLDYYMEIMGHSKTLSQGISWQN